MSVARTSLLPIVVTIAAALAPAASAQCERAHILPWDVDRTLSQGRAYFGSQVALDGDRVAVVSSVENNVRVYRLEGRHAHLETVLTSPTGQSGFAASIAMRGGILVVASANSGSTPGGGVYVYEDVGGALVLTAELVHLQPPEGTYWRVVSVDGDLIAVGAPVDDGPPEWSGSVTVFQKRGTGWVEVARLAPPGLQYAERFGARVVVDRGRVAVGAPGWGSEGYYFDGSVRVFEEVNDAWQMTAYVVPANVPYNAQVGSQVALRGDRLVTTTPSSTYGVAGHAHVFDLTDAGWKENQVIASANGVLALSDDGRTLAAGFSYESVGGQVRTYVPDGDAWALASVIEPDVLEADQSFGGALAFDGETLLVGAYGSDVVGEDVGAAYVFDMSDTWCKSLFSPTGPVSAVQGGTYTLMIDAGPEHAGRTWILAGSSTGTTPSTPFHGAEVPLVFDAYSSALETPDAGWLSHRTGHLDEEGRAAAILDVPPTLPLTLAGPVLWHAFVVLGEDGSAVHVSNVRAVKLADHPASGLPGSTSSF